MHCSVIICKRCLKKSGESNREVDIFDNQIENLISSRSGYIFMKLMSFMMFFTYHFSQNLAYYEDGSINGNIQGVPNTINLFGVNGGHEDAESTIKKRRKSHSCVLEEKQICCNAE